MPGLAMSEWCSRIAHFTAEKLSFDGEFSSRPRWRIADLRYPYACSGLNVFQFHGYCGHLLSSRRIPPPSSRFFSRTPRPCAARRPGGAGGVDGSWPSPARLSNSLFSSGPSTSLGVARRRYWMSSAQIRTAISGTVTPPIGTQIRGNLGLRRVRVFGHCNFHSA